MSKKRRLSPKEKQAKIDAAKKNEQSVKAAQERSARIKKIVTVVVCVILILGLCIPTMALSVCKSQNPGNQQNTQTEQSN